MLCTFTFSANNQSLFSTIPAGQRLVIETAAGGAEVPTGTIPLAYGLITVVGQASAGFSLVPQRVGANNGYDIFMASEQLRLYADPGSTVQLTFASSQNQQSINAGMSVAGYLVNLP